MLQNLHPILSLQWSQHWKQGSAKERCVSSKCSYLFSAWLNTLVPVMQSLLHPCRSPWNQLMDCGDLLSFLLIARLTHEAFITLHNILSLWEIILFRGEKDICGHHPLMHSWVIYSLLGQHNELQAFVFDFWNYSICLFMYLVCMIKLTIRCLCYHAGAKVTFSLPEKMQLQFLMPLDYGWCLFHNRVHNGKCNTACFLRSVWLW